MQLNESILNAYIHFTYYNISILLKKTPHYKITIIARTIILYLEIFITTLQYIHSYHLLRFNHLYISLFSHHMSIISFSFNSFSELINFYYTLYGQVTVPYEFNFRIHILILQYQSRCLFCSVYATAVVT